MVSLFSSFPDLVEIKILFIVVSSVTLISKHIKYPSQFLALVGKESFCCGVRQDSVFIVNKIFLRYQADLNAVCVSTSSPIGRSPSESVNTTDNKFSGNQLQSVLTGPLIGATLALPTALATSLLQQHVTAALRGRQAGSLIASRPFNQVELHVFCSGLRGFAYIFFFLENLHSPCYVGI